MVRRNPIFYTFTALNYVMLHYCITDSQQRQRLHSVASGFLLDK